MALLLIDIPQEVAHFFGDPFIRMLREGLKPFSAVGSIKKPRQNLETLTGDHLSQTGEGDF